MWENNKCKVVNPHIYHYWVNTTCINWDIIDMCIILSKFDQIIFLRDSTMIKAKRWIKSNKSRKYSTDFLLWQNTNILKY